MWRLVAASFTLAITAAALLVAMQPAGSATTRMTAAELASDYNGDGFADVAMGEPRRDVGAVDSAGAVHVAYGSAAGLATTGSQFLAQGVAGVPGTATAGADFGRSLASGDFNGDGFADLAASAPNNPSGVMTVLYGSQEGIQTGGGRVFSYAEVSPEPCCDSYIKVTAADFDGDGNDDLAIGLSRTDFRVLNDGGVRVLYGSASGLDTAGAQLFTQDNPEVPGTGEANDHFGAALAAGDFNGDGNDDLAIGTPGENVNDIVNSGSITVVPGSATGLTETGSAVFTQGSADVAGVNEEWDFFGTTLAAGDITGDGNDDLVVGAYGETVGSILNAGAVTTLLGSTSGLTGAGSQAFTQATSGVPNTAEENDFFSEALALGDFNGDGHADLAVGTPREDLTAGFDAGTVTVLTGTPTGLTATGSVAWAQSTAGVLDTAEAGDLCGWTLRADRIRGSDQADLVFGCIAEDTSGLTANGAIAVLPGSPSGLTAEEDQFFSGESLIGGGQSFGEFGQSIG